jgi:hypothetical protein
MTKGFFFSEEKYIQDLLDQGSLTDYQTVETPMELNVHLRATDSKPLKDPTRYRHIVRSLVYLGFTWPDISYFVHILSQLVFTHTQIHDSLFVSYVIFVRPSSVACSFHAIALYSSRHIVMLPVLVIPLTIILFLPIVSFLVVPSLIERLRSR